ncbi:NAD(P)H-binding protein [Pseudonocardia ailaonensis]|uniref:NAD(P)H-binding protein n=1 Tax=Pseudonocardia ailaonensis TaxID=367279 RepID=A0ABN2NLG9_9PSEU
MRIVIAGGHGQIALRLATLLTARGDEVTGVVRNPDHRADVEATGASVAVVDLESAAATDLAPHLEGADAVVFAAGAGPGSTAERKDTVDRAAAELLADAAAAAGVRRYLLVSATGVDAEPDPARGEVWVAYIRAKKAAEDALLGRTDLDLTILRPGTLTNDPAVGRVALSTGSLERREVTRDDVAAVLAALLAAPGTDGLTLELMGGDSPIAEAVAAVV